MWGERREGMKSPPNTAAGTEASLSLFFSGDKLNLEGEKNFVHEIFHLQVIFSGNPLSYEKSKFFFS